MLTHPDILTIEKYGYAEQDKAICFCECCEQEIYSNDEIYDIDGEVIHEDCLYDYFRKYKKICEEREY